MKQPINKTILLNMYTEYLSYAKVGRELGITRQRVHQIVTGYSTIDIRGKLVKEVRKNICEKCLVRNSVAIHHKDFNSSNNVKANLINLCGKCHTLTHKSRTLRVVRTCEECKREFTFKRRSAKTLSSAYVCNLCTNYNNNGHVHRNRNLFYPKNCVDCGIETQIGKRSHNRCMKCNEKFMYRTDIRRREYHKAYYKKNKNKPAEKERRLAWNKEYYLNNKAKFRGYATKHRLKIKMQLTRGVDKSSL